MAAAVMMVSGGCADLRFYDGAAPTHLRTIYESDQQVLYQIEHEGETYQVRRFK